MFSALEPITKGIHVVPTIKDSEVCIRPRIGLVRFNQILPSVACLYKDLSPRPHFLEFDALMTELSGAPFHTISCNISKIIRETLKRGIICKLLADKTLKKRYAGSGNKSREGTTFILIVRLAPRVIESQLASITQSYRFARLYDHYKIFLTYYLLIKLRCLDALFLSENLVKCTAVNGNT